MTRLLSVAQLLAAVAAAALPVAAAAGPPAAAVAPAVLPPDLVAKAHAVQAYPSFCSIPPMPTDTPSAEAFRTQVRETRLAGARVALASEPARFTLFGTDDFADDARQQAAPPPPMTTPQDTDTFAATARRAAAPPARSRPGPVRAARPRALPPR